VNAQRVEQLRDVVLWFQQVREDALTIGPGLASQPGAQLEAYLQREPQARCVGAFQHVLDVANRELDHDPLRARELTWFVLRHMDDVGGPTASPVPLLLFKARAWREHANALQATDDLPGAFSAANRASALLATNKACSFDRAVVQMVEAHIAWERGDTTYALTVIRDSTEVFKALRDQRRYVQARIFEGIFEFSRDKRAAAEIFASVLPAAAELHDKRELARVYQNLWQCALELNDDELAQRSYGQADELFAQHHMDAERPLIRWGYGRYLARRGQPERALAEYATASEALRAHGKLLSAAAVELDRVDVLFGTGRVEEAQAICRTLVPRFMTAGILPSAMTALAYLAAHVDSLDSQRIHYVRDFIEGLDEHPEQEFHAPRALTT
jgi:tetratricopeptide (TPR) repeat protein